MHSSLSPAWRTSRRDNVSDSSALSVGLPIALYQRRLSKMARLPTFTQRLTLA